jgi:cytochrome bd-type quinol oxidase subunit 2
MNVSTTDRIDAKDDDSTGGSTHSQAFLQQRVALFALAGFLLGLTFLVFRVASSLAAGRLSLIHPSMITHVIGMATYLTVWLIARRGRYSSRTIRGLENAAIVLTAVFYTAMATMLPIGLISAAPLPYITLGEGSESPSLGRAGRLEGAGKEAIREMRIKFDEPL